MTVADLVFSNSPESIINSATLVPDNNPVIHRVCLTSGGGDSTVLAHRCRDFYDELVHIDTGTALPGVRDFVESFARDVVGKPLRVVEAGDAYVRLVLGTDEWWKIYYEHRRDDEGPDDFRDRTLKLPTRKARMAMGANIAPLGFPGPAGHSFAYQRLKERQLEEALREVKALFGNGKRAQRVMLLSGVRMSESGRRKMTSTAQGEWERRGNQLWVNPLIAWTNLEMVHYRKEYGLPISDVTALTHRSGECNCGSFATPGEREEIKGWWSEWFEKNIGWMERRAKLLGLRSHVWGERPKEGLVPANYTGGMMCTSCEINLEVFA